MQRIETVTRLSGAVFLGFAMLGTAGLAQADDAQQRKNEAEQYNAANYEGGLTETLCSMLWAEEARLRHLDAVSKSENPYAVIGDLEERLDCARPGLGEQLKDAGKADSGAEDADRETCLRDPSLRNDPDCRLKM